MNVTRTKDKLLDIPWSTMNQSWNAKDLELTKVSPMGYATPDW